ncbi:unnamed protein product [Notodromas monacha]|uniref:Uncharacterized protein n=1 Tax=Notodromas monacha TaxID=399045 RepID=A0A7R9GHA6_9CRUS|nr:unnamed protein product [Notodromas monacha]CAG0921271.1 unnamed protein product [Notodromas monacha]
MNVKRNQQPMESCVQGTSDERRRAKVGLRPVVIPVARRGKWPRFSPCTGPTSLSNGLSTPPNYPQSSQASYSRAPTIKVVDSSHRSCGVKGPVENGGYCWTPFKNTH